MPNVLFKTVILAPFTVQKGSSTLKVAKYLSQRLEKKFSTTDCSRNMLGGIHIKKHKSSYPLKISWSQEVCGNDLSGNDLV